MTPVKTYKSFLKSTPVVYLDAEQAWMKAMFGVIYKVARRNPQFTVDDIWAAYDKARPTNDALRFAHMDNRILGPMIRHMVSEGLLGSTGYFTRSTRPGGGSRPVTIWESYLTKSTKAAA